MAELGQVVSVTAPAGEEMEHLVIDSGAIIAGVSLAGIAKNYWVLDEVAAEIRDARARDRLTSLPFEVKSRRPSDEALASVVAFAKKTGDFRELSRTDLLVLALVYMLEKETCGTAHLRTEPRVVPAEPEAPALTRTQKRRLQRARRSAAGATGDAADAVEGGGDADSAAGGDDDASAGGGAGAGAAAGAGVTAGGSAGEGAAAVVVASETAGSAAAAPSVPAGDAAVKGDDGGGSDGSCSDDDAAGDDDDDDDGGEWIGPESTTRRSTWTDSGAAADGDAAPQRPVRVGCVTTDYAMQNVLLQIGLNLVSLNGRAVRTVKQWVLKCDACFEITAKMDKLFCPKCGNATLAKLGVTLRSNGVPEYHYRRGRKANIRGTKFPLPKPKGGPQGDLLLREDQLLSGIWRHRAQKKETLTTMFADASASDVMAPRRVVGGDVVVGFGRKNPNSARGRERRGKKRT